jgi:lambda repressor-like predicted transcriptional regulator
VRQLALDGREVEHPPRHPRSLIDRNRAALAYVRSYGPVRLVQIGNMLHNEGFIVCYGEAGKVGCCARAGNDGVKALTALAGRGLVQRIHRGLWRATDTAEDWTPRRILTDAQEAEIVAAYRRRGATMASIAAEHFVSPMTVHRVLRQHDVVRRRIVATPRLDPGEILRTCELYGEGLTLSELAEALGICATTAAERLRRHCPEVIRPCGGNPTPPRTGRELAAFVATIDARHQPASPASLDELAGAIAARTK